MLVPTVGAWVSQVALVVKNSLANSGYVRDTCSIPWRRAWHPTPIVQACTRPPLHSPEQPSCPRLTVLLRRTQKNCLPCGLWDPSCSPRQPQCRNRPYFFEKDRPSLDLPLQMVKNTAAASKALLVPRDRLPLLHKAALHLHHLF